MHTTQPTKTISRCELQSGTIALILSKRSSDQILSKRTYNSICLASVRAINFFRNVVRQHKSATSYSDNGHRGVGVLRATRCPWPYGESCILQKLGRRY